MTEELLKQRKAMLEELIHDKAYTPMKLKELAVLLDVPKSQREGLKEILDLLLAEGKVSVSKKGKYGLPQEFARAGIFSGHPRGFGFVTVEGLERDIFIPAEKTGDSFQLSPLRRSAN